MKSAGLRGIRFLSVSLFGLLAGSPLALSADWPQYRGPNTDGTTSDAIAPVWATNSPGFVVWENSSLTNGFSSVAVSQGRAFVIISRDDGQGHFLEYCVGLDAATGVELWATPIGEEVWSPASTGDGGAGAYPYDTGDGPRTTPSVAGDRVLALSERLEFVCLDAASGAVVWSNDLYSAYGATSIPWDNAASPSFDGDLAFVNLNTSIDNRTLAAFRISDGSLAWSSQNENVTHTTPIVATIEGVRQVIFATQTGLVALNRDTGDFLWKFTYPFYPISTSMGAAPVIYSNLVYVTAAYGRGAAAARVSFANGVWTATQLYYMDSSAGLPYRSIWMTPVIYQGYIYTLCGENSTFITPPLSCIELSTGELKWSVDNFGMGGLILVGANLLVLTEDGQLVLVRPDPAAYQELARYRAFYFSGDNRGKCWIHPAFSNGRVYAHSTRGAICLDLSPSSSSAPLKLLSPRLLSQTQLQLDISTADGSPITPERLAKIEIRASTNLDAPPAAWAKLTNRLVLVTNGVVRCTNTLSAEHRRQFFKGIELPQAISKME